MLYFYFVFVNRIFCSKKPILKYSVTPNSSSFKRDHNFISLTIFVYDFTSGYECPYPTYLIKDVLLYQRFGRFLSI